MLNAVKSAVCGKKWLVFVLVCCMAVLGSSVANAVRKKITDSKETKEVSKKEKKEAKKPVDEKGLVAYWNFDDGQGTTAKDSTGKGNDAVLNGMDGRTCWVDGISGKALSFDGVKSYVDCGSKEIFNFGTNSFTFSLWVYVKSSITEYDRAICKGGNSDSQPGFSIGLGLGDWGASITDPEKKQAGVLFGTESESLNQWVYLAVVVDREANLVYGYRDGILTGSSDITGFGSVSNTFPITIGTIPYVGYWFKGIIDEVKLYNRALSMDEIKSQYDSLAKK